MTSSNQNSEMFCIYRGSIMITKKKKKFNIFNNVVTSHKFVTNKIHTPLSNITSSFANEFYFICDCCHEKSLYVNYQKLIVLQH